MRTKFCLSVACGIALCISAGSVARADLLVTSRIRYYSTNYSNGNRIILRFDDHTGALINQFGYVTEGFEGMTVGPDERIYVTSNMMGWGDVYRFSMLVVRGGNPNDEFSGQLLLLANVAADGHNSTLTLPDDQPDTAPALTLKFKYYQRVEGTFRVPNGGQLKSLQARVVEPGQATPKATRSLNLT